MQQKAHNLWPKQLKRKKKDAHAAFDRLWLSGLMTRKEAYAWLAKNLKKQGSACHISKFTGEECDYVVWLVGQLFGPLETKPS